MRSCRPVEVGAPCTKAVGSGNLAIYQMVFKEVGDTNEGHAHGFHHFTLVASGKIKVRSNGKDSIHEEGAMVWIPRGVSHLMTGLEPFTTVYCIHALHKKEDVGDVLDDADVPGGTPDWLKVAPLLEKDLLKTMLEGTTIEAISRNDNR